MSQPLQGNKKRRIVARQKKQRERIMKHGRMMKKKFTKAKK